MRRTFTTLLTLCLLLSTVKAETFTGIDYELPGTLISGSEYTFLVTFTNEEEVRVPYYLNLTLEAEAGTPDLKLGEFKFLNCDEIATARFVCPEYADPGSNEVGFNFTTPAALYPGDYKFTANLVVVSEEHLFTETVYRYRDSPVEVEEVVKEVIKEVEVPVYRNKTVEKQIEVPVEVPVLDWFWVFVAFISALLLGIVLTKLFMDWFKEKKLNHKTK